MKTFQTLLLVLLAILLCDSTKAQEDASLVFGFEISAASDYLNDFYKNANYTSSQVRLSVDIPLQNNFSVGTGLLMTKYGRIKKYEDTGILTKRLDNADVYAFEMREYPLTYYGIPIRVQYRFLKSKCAFIQAAFRPEIYGKNTQDFKMSYQEINENDSPDLFGDIRNLNAAIELGAGMRLHLTNRFRLYIKTTFERVLFSYFNKQNISLNQNYVRFSLGAQYAILK